MKRAQSSASSSGAFPREALCLEDATVDTCFCTDFLKDFDLPKGQGLPYRVFVLRCQQARILTGGFAYYVGFIDKDGLQEHLEKYFTRRPDSARFTRVNEPLGVELLWPVQSRAAEAYLFAFLLGKLDEDAALRHVRLGGWTQTNVAPLPVAAFNSLQREWRMVHDRCLDCGLAGHFAGSSLCVQAQQGVKAKAAPSSSSSSAASVPSLPMPLPVAVAAKAIAPAPAANAVEPAPAPKAVPPAPVEDLDGQFDSWITSKGLIDSDGWISLNAVLKALGEAWKSPRRYVLANSDCPAKLWTLGVDRRAPTQDTDFKQEATTRGGYGPFVVRKTFLKDVMLERCRHKLS